MEYAELGWSGIEVSKVCLGGMSFGEPSPRFHQWTLGPDDTRAVVARALDDGVNFIDTANCYSFGTSEEYIGRALRDLGVDRSKVVLASKVFFNEGASRRRPSSVRSTGRSLAWAPTTSTSTSSTATTTKPTPRRPWARSTPWCAPAR